jgi:hypothetical protein
MKVIPPFNMPTLLEEIAAAQASLDRCRSKLGKVENYYSASKDEMYQYYQIMRQKQAEKFIEGWVATQIGGKKISRTNVPDQFKKNDNGDIWVGDELKIGHNNIELKSSFASTPAIGGGQFRFYENVPFYLLYKVWDKDFHEMFLLRKEQLVDEIISRARNTSKSAFVSSQGSGIISKMDTEQRIRRLQDNVNGTYHDKLGWSFNSQTEKEFYEDFKDKYLVTPQEVKEIINGL